MKDCILYDRKCTECKECDYCDINPDKVCNNCCKCIETNNDYKAVIIDEIILPKK